jgi:hypothetical protein
MLWTQYVLKVHCKYKIIPLISYAACIVNYIHFCTIIRHRLTGFQQNLLEPSKGISA